VSRLLADVRALNLQLCELDERSPALERHIEYLKSLADSNLPLICQTREERPTCIAQSEARLRRSQETRATIGAKHRQQKKSVDEHIKSYATTACQTICQRMQEYFPMELREIVYGYLLNDIIMGIFNRENGGSLPDHSIIITPGHYVCGVGNKARFRCWNK
jgi:hypothetical protein